MTTPPTVNCLNAAKGRNWTMYQGDSAEILPQLPPGR